MDKRNRTQNHIELVIELYKRIPYQTKITAKELKSLLESIGLIRTERTIQRNLVEICQLFPDVLIDDRDKPFGYRRQATPSLELAPYEIVLLHWSLAAFSYQSESLFSTILNELQNSFCYSASDYHSVKNKIRYIHSEPNLSNTLLTQGAIFQTVCQALFQQRYLNISLLTNLSSVLKIIPLALIYYRNTPILIFRRDQNPSNNALSLSEVHQASLSSYRFNYPESFELHDYSIDELLKSIRLDSEIFVINHNQLSK